MATVSARYLPKLNKLAQEGFLVKIGKQPSEKNFMAIQNLDNNKFKSLLGFCSILTKFEGI